MGPFHSHLRLVYPPKTEEALFAKTVDQSFPNTIAKRVSMISTAPRAHLLQRTLLDARARTLMLAGDLTGPQLLGPRLKIVNPPLWELGHLAWFQERWCLRVQEEGDALHPSILQNADGLYDSSTVVHETRWNLPLPSFEATLGYLAAVLERVLDRLTCESSRRLEYFVELAALHEEMHCEAWTYTRQTLGYGAPRAETHAPPCVSVGSLMGEVEVTGGVFMLGASPGAGFVFDNEKWSHPVTVESFGIARTCVTNGEFMAFVENDGYVRRELWCPEGWAWRVLADASHPMYWDKHVNGWHMRRYDAWAPVEMNAAVMHVNWYEADAYCRWAGRRLPSEAEWECAASTGPGNTFSKRRYPWGDTEPDHAHANVYGSAGGSVDVAAYAPGDSAWGCRQLIGNVWEWTADTFEPYPGFTADPYREYSEPWFGDHKVLRGGSFATRAHLIRNTWRNFYTPERRDVFAGFRTCA